jgi:3-phenylpropionate/trans-cinnamate dioxygenase ferredoxin component
MGEWVNVGAASEIGPEGKYALLGDEEILLVRHGEKVYALAYLCSHQDMEMEGGHCEGEGWVCPHHGARFSLETGEALSMPAVEPVKRFDVKVEAGEVYVKEPNA